MKKLTMWVMAVLMGLLTMGWANAQEATLGVGDVVKISVYGSPDLNTETRVSETGHITFPLLGQVKVGGLTVAQAEKEMGNRLEKGNFLRKAQVNILVTGIQSQQIAVLGAVNRPGRYPIEGKRSVLDMLALAGGMNPDGADTISVIRKRNGQTSKETIDVVEMIRNGDLNRDYDLAANDIIYVERSPRFYIYGEVQRPGAFRLERSMTVLQALAVGGGLTPRGTERGMQIKRRGADGKLQIIDAARDDMVQIDDVVYIKESWF
jgi:polysaccharide export outer membrane protein